MSPLYSRCVLISAEGKEGFPSLLATLCLMQPRMLLIFVALRAHCWFMFRCLPGSQDPSLPSCSPASQPLLCIGAWGYFSSHVERTSHFLLLNFMNSCQPISPACWDPPEQQHNHLEYQLLLPDLYHLQTSWRCTLPITEVINDDTFFKLSHFCLFL